MAGLACSRVLVARCVWSALLFMNRRTTVTRLAAAPLLTAAAVLTLATINCWPLLLLIFISICRSGDSFFKLLTTTTVYFYYYTTIIIIWPKQFRRYFHGFMAKTRDWPRSICWLLLLLLLLLTARTNSFIRQPMTYGASMIGTQRDGVKAALVTGAEYWKETSWRRGMCSTLVVPALL